MSEPTPTPEPKKGKRATKVEVVRRLSLVYDLMLEGAQLADLRAYAAQNGWELSRTQMKRYMARCHKMMVASLEKNKERSLAKHILMRFRLFKDATDVANLAVALSVLRDIADLENLYPNPKTEPPPPPPPAINIVNQLAPSAFAEFMEDVRSAKNGPDINGTNGTNGHSPGARK